MPVRASWPLHNVGKAYRVADPSSWQVESNVKLVMSVNRPLADFRAELVANGVPMESWPRDLTGFVREESTTGKAGI
jgi:hypothetical protein